MKWEDETFLFKLTCCLVWGTACGLGFAMLVDDDVHDVLGIIWNHFLRFEHARRMR